MQMRIPTVYMRGGTSKGLFFPCHLAADPETRTESSWLPTEARIPTGVRLTGWRRGFHDQQVCIISASSDPDYDVNYHFGQVSIDNP